MYVEKGYEETNKYFCNLLGINDFVILNSFDNIFINAITEKEQYVKGEEKYGAFLPVNVYVERKKMIPSEFIIGAVVYIAKEDKQYFIDAYNKTAVPYKRR